MHKNTQQNRGGQGVNLGKEFFATRTFRGAARTSDYLSERETIQFKMILFTTSPLLDPILLHFPLFSLF